jgi:hypothetical protein
MEKIDWLFLFMVIIQGVWFLIISAELADIRKKINKLLKQLLKEE